MTKSPGEILKQALRVAGLTVPDLAETWGVSRQQTYSVLSGDVQMSLAKAIKASELVGISLDQLAGKEVSPKEEAVAELFAALAQHFRKGEEKK